MILRKNEPRNFYTRCWFSNMINYLLLLLAAFIWGSTFVAQSVGMDYIGPFTFSSTRSIIGSVVLIPVVLLINYYNKKKGIKPVDAAGRELSKEEYIKNTLIGGLCCGLILFVASNLQQVGIQYTTPGKAGFITALYVVLVPISGIFFKKKVHPIVWLSVVLSVIGLYLLCINAGDDVAGALGFIGRGELLVLLCAFAFTGHILVIDHFSHKSHAVAMSSIQFLVNFLLSSIAMFIMEKPDMDRIFAAAIPILYAGVLSSGVAYTLQIVAQKKGNPTICSLIMCLESVFSVLSAWLVLHEQMTTRHIVGCVLMFVAIIIAEAPKPKL